jgi:Cytochrome P450
MSGFVWPVRPFGPLRDWAYWLFTWGLRRDINRCFKFLLPLIDKRVEQKKSPSKSDQEEPLDMVQGLLEMDIPSPEEATSLRHAHRILHLTFAASAVSSALILHTLHQTLTTPEHILELREEISRCLKDYGGWNEKALLNMQFLESYIREMLRLCPPSVRKYFRWEMWTLETSKNFTKRRYRLTHASTSDRSTHYPRSNLPLRQPTRPPRRLPHLLPRPTDPH